MRKTKCLHEKDPSKRAASQEGEEKLDRWQRHLWQKDLSVPNDPTFYSKNEGFHLEMRDMSRTRKKP